MSNHYDPDIQAQKDYEALNAETARKLVRTAIKLKKAEARIAELEAALESKNTCKHVWTNEFGLQPFHCIYCGKPLASEAEDD